MDMRRIAVLLIVFITLYTLHITQTFAQPGTERVFVLREAAEERQGTAAVEAYLVGDILEVKVSVRIRRARPKIYNTIVVGPKLGRISPISITQLFATTEKEEPYPTKKRGGLISFGDGAETKKIKGAVVRKLFKFKIPPEKIKPDGKYQIWVKLKEEGSKVKRREGKITLFKFDLEKLPELTRKSLRDNL